MGQKVQNRGQHWLHVVPSSWEKGIFMASLGLCTFPLQNDKSSTPGLKSNTPTPRNDAPTPGTSTTPGLRSMPGKPPGMDPIGIMGRHCGAGLPAGGRGWGVCPGPGLEPRRWARAPGRVSELGPSQGLSLWDLLGFEKVSAQGFNADVQASWSHCPARCVEGAPDKSAHLLSVLPLSLVL